MIGCVGCHLLDLTGLQVIEKNVEVAFALVRPDYIAAIDVRTAMVYFVVGDICFL
jgi:hypothetical protein